jgi:hypothetical protein
MASLLVEVARMMVTMVISMMLLTLHSHLSRDSHRLPFHVCRHDHRHEVFSTRVRLCDIFGRHEHHDVRAGLLRQRDVEVDGAESSDRKNWKSIIEYDIESPNSPAENCTDNTTVEVD